MNRLFSVCKSKTLTTNSNTLFTIRDGIKGYKISIFLILFQFVFNVINIVFNDSWDEWVPEDRVYKINAENLKQQKELEERQK
jgi:hypothetical protein